MTDMWALGKWAGLRLLSAPWEGGRVLEILHILRLGNAQCDVVIIIVELQKLHNWANTVHTFWGVRNIP